LARTILSPEQTQSLHILIVTQAETVIARADAAVPAQFLSLPRSLRIGDDAEFSTNNSKAIGQICMHGKIYGTQGLCPQILHAGQAELEAIRALVKSIASLPHAVRSIRSGTVTVMVKAVACA
jgi:hypothetical protein